METTKHSHKRPEHKESRPGWDHNSEETYDEKSNAHDMIDYSR